MVFTLITKKEYPILNPLIKNYIIISEKFEFPIFYPNELYLIETFELAIELGYDVNYLNDQLDYNIWWTDSIDHTIASILKEKIKKIEKEFFISKKFIDDQGTQYEDENVIVLFDTRFKIFCKKISSYFKEIISFEFTTTYKNHYRKKLKVSGLVEKEYTLISLVSYLKKLFNTEYYLYVVYILKLFDTIPITNSSGNEAWDNLFFVENYFNEIKIYGLSETTKYDFKFEKDENKKYFVQYEYNLSESSSGRMFPVNLNKYQALQTIPKKDRNLLKAEEGCLFVEFDYKNFELTIFETLYHKMAIKESWYDKDFIIEPNPHEFACEYLGIDPLQYRNFGKTINYSIIYGMSISSIANLITEECIQKNKDEMMVKLSSYYLYKAAGLLESIIKCEHVNGRTYIHSHNKRFIKITKEYAVLNALIQASAVDIFFKKVKIIIDFIKDFKISNKNKLLIQNHDSILIQLEASNINRTAIVKHIQALLLKSSKLLKLEVEMKIGVNWGEME